MVLPKLRTHWVSSDKKLLNSFALVGESIVFCESCEGPKLVIFSTVEESDPKILDIQFEVGIQQPIYIGDGPPGYVTVICKEWVEVQNKSEVLRLVSLEDGSTVWTMKLEVPSDLEKFPDLVTYHNGYLYIFINSTQINVLNVKSGKAGLLKLN